MLYSTSSGEDEQWLGVLLMQYQCIKIALMMRRWYVDKIDQLHCKCIFNALSMCCKCIEIDQYQQSMRCTCSSSLRGIPELSLLHEHITILIIRSNSIVTWKSKYNWFDCMYKNFLLLHIYHKNVLYKNCHVISYEYIIK